MPALTKNFLVGKWTHEEWSFELTMFNYLKIEWANGGKAHGAWILRDDNEVVFSFNYLGDEDKQTYMFCVQEIIDENTIKTLDLEQNKVEVFSRYTA